MFANSWMRGLVYATLVLTLSGCLVPFDDGGDPNPGVAQNDDRGRENDPNAIDFDNDQPADVDPNAGDNGGNGGNGGNGDDGGGDDGPAVGGGFPADDPPPAPGTGGDSSGGDDPVVPPSPPSIPPSPPGTPDPQEQVRLIAEITDALGDRFYETQSSSGNSSNTGFVTGVEQMQLCKFGRFGRVEKTFFSGTTGDFSSEDVFLGTWSIKLIQGSAVLELNIDQSSEPLDNPIRQILIEQAADGRILFDGQVATEQDAAADCAAAQASGG